MDRIPALDTQPKLAAKAGIGQSTVSRLLLQEQGATVDMLDAFAAAFGIQTWELLADSDSTREAAYQRMILGARGDLSTMPLPDATVRNSQNSRPRKSKKPPR